MEGIQCYCGYLSFHLMPAHPILPIVDNLSPRISTTRSVTMVIDIQPVYHTWIMSLSLFSMLSFKNIFYTIT